MTLQEELEEVKKWLLKEITGTITAEEKIKLHEWAKENENNQAFLEQILSEPFLVQAVLDKNKRKNKEEWQKLYHKIGYIRSLHLSFSKWMSIAAMFCLLLGGIFYFQNKEVLINAGSSKAFLQMADSTYILNGEMLNYAQYVLNSPTVRKQRTLNAEQDRKIIVPRGGEYKILLEDSTLIHLGPESILIIPIDFSSHNRQLTISGEAYFTIHKDSLHPFQIHSNNADILVKGTELNIETYPDESETRITLICGKAELQTSAGINKELPVGHTGIICAGKEPRVVQTNIEECTAWHHNRWIFENRPVNEIMKKLARWYDMEVSFADTISRDFHITMNMDKYETFNKLAQTIQKMNELQIQIKKNNTIIISENKLNHN